MMLLSAITAAWCSLLWARAALNKLRRLCDKHCITASRQGKRLLLIDPAQVQKNDTGCDLSSSSTVWVSSSYVAAATAVLLLLQTQVRMSCASCLTDRKITSKWYPYSFS
jgi:hypothetical protein